MAEPTTTRKPRARKAAASKTAGVKASKATMSDEHKAALAAGRTEGRAVRQYLEALESHKPKRGRQRTAESISARIATIDKKLFTADPLTRVLLAQERLDLEAELAGKDDTVDIGGLEAEFVAAAAAYGARKGISYTAWRSVGVDADVLKRAGISRARS